MAGPNLDLLRASLREWREQLAARFSRYTWAKALMGSPRWDARKASTLDYVIDLAGRYQSGMGGEHAIYLIARMHDAILRLKEPEAMVEEYEQLAKRVNETSAKVKEIAERAERAAG